MERKGKTESADMQSMPGACVAASYNHPNGFPFLTHGAVGFSPNAWQEIQHGLKLSGRELQLIQGIFDNKVEYSIAAGFGISVNTVRTELRRLRHKLKAADRVSLVLRVVEEFLRLTTSTETKLPAICRNHSNGLCPLLRAVVGAEPDLTRKPKSGRASATATKALQFLSVTQIVNFFQFSEFGLWFQG